MTGLQSELDAISVTTEALSKLDTTSRERVLKYLTDRFDFFPRPHPVQHTKWPTTSTFYGSKSVADAIGTEWVGGDKGT